ncbi:Putative Mannosyl-oligosaccharide 1,2-alpha-mannosidase IB [Aspergillus calidoustus]|uniref:alpha-1,2-Mannosidase n=1 Tax=Aspergillus calidoustus TaxID=454130 RepID=A0A0U5GDU4_ASPCI|nr:Putative Mannosyl-oligosaccharide 1,2-alpha-mannosidase IB [Aspergillus calidoustus]
MLALNKRWSTVLVAASFLFFLVLLHSKTPNSTVIRVAGTYGQNLCPATPPNPPYNRTNPEGFSWRDIPVRYPVQNPIPLSNEPPIALPQIQFSFPPPTPEAEEIRKARQQRIKETFLKGWHSYETRAWKTDELQPISGLWRNTFGGWGATLVDNLDTLLIMGLHEEFERAVAGVLDVDFNPHSSSQSNINLFETTIRYLGGFIAAYDLSGCSDTRLLDKAVQIGDMIYASFDTDTRMPVTRWNPHKAAGGEEQFPAAQGIIAEIASSSLELTRLSQLTGDMRYFDAISRITDVLDEQQFSTRIPGLWPVAVNVQKPDLTQSSTFTFGGMADSAYEYLGKTYQLLGGVGRAPQYKKLYDGAMAAGAENLLFRPMVPDHADILVAGVAHATTSTIGMETRSEHLACFAGGMYALGGKLFANDSHLAIGRKLTDGCIWLYKNSPLGIMPEMFSLSACPSRGECPWDERQEVVFTTVRDKRYILRPEAIESVFYMWRITGEERYRDAAWEMFEAIDRATSTEWANAALRDVMEPNVNGGGPEKEDSMESFWLAETLKYLYLIFSETDLVSLDHFVFNTEAHPFRLPGRE